MLSIGYHTVRDVITNGVRHLQELKLYEVSIVTFPMNELATVSSVKSEDLMADQVRLFRERLRATEKAWRDDARAEPGEWISYRIFLIDSDRAASVA